MKFAFLIQCKSHNQNPNSTVNIKLGSKCYRGFSPAEVVLFATVSHSALPLPHTATSQAVHLEGVKGVLSGCVQGHGSITPRMGTPPDVGIGVDKRLDVKVEKPLSHFTRHHTLDYILHVIHAHINNNYYYGKVSKVSSVLEIFEDRKKTFMNQSGEKFCGRKLLWTIHVVLIRYLAQKLCRCHHGIHNSFCLRSFTVTR